MNRRFALMFALGLSTLATVAHVDTAEAGRYRFGGGGHVRVHARVPSGGVSVSYSRSPGWYAPRRTWSVGGSVYVGSGYYPRYRYYYARPYYYYYQPVPSYYGYYEQNYYPVAPQAAAPQPQPPAVAAVAPARRELPKFGLGLFAGGVSVEDKNESSDVGVLARYRLTRGLLIEGELGKTSYEDNLRVDRRLGASLIYEFSPYNRLAPYVVAGLGVQQANVDGDFNTTQNFGELGVGLRLALTPNVHLLLDVRAGSRATVASDQPDLIGAAARTVSPPSENSDQSEEYTRARLSGVLYF